MILFSTDVMDHYRNNEELIDNYVDFNGLNEEDVMEIAEDELLDMAYEWAYEWVNYDAKELMDSVLNRLDNMFETFKVRMLFKTWRNSTTVTETIEGIEDFVDNFISSYRGIDNIMAELKNGKIIIWASHHDATDGIEITALQNGRPIRIKEEDVM